MHIDSVALVVADLDLSAAFYEHVLELPVSRVETGAEVIIGTTILELHGDPAHVGHHHLAITVPSNKFGAAKEWIGERVDLLALDGADEFETSPAWNARSVYFMSPDGAILEFIVRRELGNATSGPFSSSDLLCVSEVGIAVDDVSSAVRGLAEHGIAAYGGNTSDFAPVGDVDGLLILVGAGRPWFPTTLVAHPSSITVGALSGRSAELTLAPASHLRMR